MCPMWIPKVIPMFYSEGASTAFFEMEGAAAAPSKPPLSRQPRLRSAGKAGARTAPIRVEWVVDIGLFERRVELGVDQIRAAAPETALQRGRHVAGLLHCFAGDAERAGQADEVDQRAL